jgi:hypothetical protein
MPYTFLKRQFYGKMWWLWIVQAVLYCAVGAYYYMVPGKELVYAIYIPLDIVLTISLAAFYYSTYRTEKRREEIDEKMKQMIQDKLSAGVAGLMASARSENTDSALNSARFETKQLKKSQEADKEYCA